MTPELTVGALAATRPLSIKVLQRHGIDFCCGGGRSLVAACERREVDVDALLHEVDVEEAVVAEPVVRWDQRPVAELVDFLVRRYHRPLDEELPRLAALADKVAHVHGALHPELADLAEAVHAVVDDITPHLAHEESVVFPLLLARADGGREIGELRDEHDAIGALLARIVALTDGFVVPEGACRSWTALWQGLEQLDADTRAHIHLENNVLFAER